MNIIPNLHLRGCYTLMGSDELYSHWPEGVLAVMGPEFNPRPGLLGLKKVVCFL